MAFPSHIDMLEDVYVVGLFYFSIHLIISLRKGVELAGK